MENGQRVVKASYLHVARAEGAGAGRAVCRAEAEGNEHKGAYKLVDLEQYGLDAFLGRMVSVQVTCQSARSAGGAGRLCGPYDTFNTLTTRD